MGRVITEENLDEIVDDLLARAQSEPEGPYITFAKYYREGQYLEMKLTDGRRLLVPREELKALRNASDEQIEDLVVLEPGWSVYWPQLDDGLALADFLEHRWKDAIAA